MSTEGKWDQDMWSELQTEVARLRARLDATEDALLREREVHERLARERDALLAAARNVIEVRDQPPCSYPEERAAMGAWGDLEAAVAACEEGGEE